VEDVRSDRVHHGPWVKVSLGAEWAGKGPASPLPSSVAGEREGRNPKRDLAQSRKARKGRLRSDERMGLASRQSGRGGRGESEARYPPRSTFARGRCRNGTAIAAEAGCPRTTGCGAPTSPLHGKIEARNSKRRDRRAQHRTSNIERRSVTRGNREGGNRGAADSPIGLPALQSALRTPHSAIVTWRRGCHSTRSFNPRMPESNALPCKASE